MFYTKVCGVLNTRSLLFILLSNKRSTRDCVVWGASGTSNSSRIKPDLALEFLFAKVAIGVYKMLNFLFLFFLTFSQSLKDIHNFVVVVL